MGCGARINTLSSMAGGPLREVLRNQLQHMRHSKPHASPARRGGYVHEASWVV